MPQVGFTEEGVRQTSQLASRRTFQAGADDRARRSLTSLARERHVPNVQHGEQCIASPRNSEKVFTRLFVSDDNVRTVV